MVSSSDSSNQAKNPLTRLLDNISSYDGNVMLAAIVSLLLVILFVLLLHIYAKWFLAQARQRRRRSSISASHVLRPAHRFHHFHSFTFDNTSTLSSSPNSKGLEASMIASIPLFVYTSNEQCKQGLECVICLSGFEDNEVGRSLPKCGHGFHVECIDMWLHSHSNCPICRAPVVGDKSAVATVLNVVENDGSNSMEAASVEILDIVVEGELSRLERVSDVSNREMISDHDVGVGENDSLSSPSSPSTSSANASPLGYCSLKRMLSRNISSPHDQSKVFPSSKDLLQDA